MKESRMGKHRPDKRQHTWWCFAAQWEALGGIAKRFGVTTSGLFNGIADGRYEVKEAHK